MTLLSPTFLFLFLPVALLAIILVGKRLRGILLLAASLVFIAFQEPRYVIFYLAFAVLNFGLGWLLEKHRDNDLHRRILLIFSISLNVLVLILFKLLFQFKDGIIGLNPSDLFGLNNLVRAFIIPIGISYTSFQMIAYHLDIANEITDSEKNLIRFLNFVLMFPKMPSGPITRYRQLEQQLINPDVSVDNTAEGLRRFIIGLSKKVLIADVLAKAINPVFNLPSANLPIQYAWFALVGFSIQLYFDFSGFTDMAIGIGKVLGYQFTENFNHPYIANSVSDFWRRWHISLSSWFRDYIFLPIEISQRRKRFIPQQASLLLIFVLTGLWHGFTLNYLIWGCVFALAMILETANGGEWYKKISKPVQHVWTLAWVMLSWIFFRSPSVAFAWGFFKSLVGAQPVKYYTYTQLVPIGMIDNSTWLALAVGLLLSSTVLISAGTTIRHKSIWLENHQIQTRMILDVLLLVLLVLSVAMSTATGFTPGVYERF